MLHLFSEGATDREVFLSAVGDQGWEIYPQKPKPCTVSAAEGYDAIRSAFALVKQGVAPVYLALDLDLADASSLYGRVEADARGLGVEVSSTAAGIFQIEGGELRVVPVGLPADERLKSLGVTKHAIDDFLVLLLLERSAYDGWASGEKKHPPRFETIEQGLPRLLESFRQNGVPVESSKQVLDVLCAMMAYRASPATLAQDVLRRSKGEVVRRILDPLAQSVR